MTRDLCSLRSFSDIDRLKVCSSQYTASEGDPDTRAQQQIRREQRLACVCTRSFTGTQSDHHLHIATAVFMLQGQRRPF